MHTIFTKWRLYGCFFTILHQKAITEALIPRKLSNPLLIVSNLICYQKCTNEITYI